MSKTSLARSRAHNYAAAIALRVAHANGFIHVTRGPTIDEWAYLDAARPEHRYVTTAPRVSAPIVYKIAVRDDREYDRACVITFSTGRGHVLHRISIEVGAGQHYECIEEQLHAVVGSHMKLLKALLTEQCAVAVGGTNNERKRNARS